MNIIFANLLALVISLQSPFSESTGTVPPDSNWHELHLAHGNSFMLNHVPGAPLYNHRLIDNPLLPFHVFLDPYPVTEDVRVDYRAARNLYGL